MRPAELDRRRERDQFDPIAEGARLGLSHELALTIWQRVCVDATDAAGRCNVAQARRWFHEIAALVAARGGRLHPDAGRLTRVDTELGGEVPEVSRSPLRACVPGRETLVATEARGRSHGSGEQAAATAGAIARQDIPGANGAVQAMAALQLPASSATRTPPQASGYERMNRFLEVDLSNSHPGVRESHSVWARPAESLGLRAFARAREAPARISEPAEPGRTLDLRFRLAEVDALQEVMQLALDALASGRLPDHALGSALVSSPRHPAMQSDAGTFRPHLMERDAVVDAGDSWTPCPPSVAPWITGGGAPLTDVAHRRAATIFRRELVDADVDLHDPAIEEALARAGHGEPLPESVRQDMEAHLGASFRNVRVHTDSVATRAAELLHASAFTLGEDIFFAAGAFAPSGESGRRLLAHELTHVIQSQQGRVPTSAGIEVSRPTDALETEANTAYDRLAAQVPATTAPAPAASPGRPASGMLLRDLLPTKAKLLEAYNRQMALGVARLGAKAMTVRYTGERAARDVEETYAHATGDKGFKPGRVQSPLGGKFLEMYLDHSVDPSAVAAAGLEIQREPDFKRIENELKAKIQRLDKHLATQDADQRLLEVSRKYFKEAMKHGIQFKYETNTIIGGVSSVEVKDATLIHPDSEDRGETIQSEYEIHVVFKDTYDFANKRSGVYDQYRKRLANHLARNEYEKFWADFRSEASGKGKTKLDEAAVFASFMYALERKGWTPGPLPWEVAIPIKGTVTIPRPKSVSEPKSVSKPKSVTKPKAK